MIRTDGNTEPDPSQMEISSSWALFIMIMLLIAALFTSYLLSQKKVEAVHETVISIFAGWYQMSSAMAITNSGRYDGRIDPKNEQWNLDTGSCGIRLPDLL